MSDVLYICLKYFNILFPQVVDPKRAIPREQMSPLLPNHPPSFLEIEPDPGCKLSLSGNTFFFEKN